jgi:hypothetical protein
MGDEEAKRFILARRARFVAAALAGLNAAMCGGQTDSPSACLSIALEAGAPQPCLTQILPSDAGASDAGASDADAAPQPCLAPLPPDAGDAGDGG